MIAWKIDSMIDAWVDLLIAGAQSIFAPEDKREEILSEYVAKHYTTFYKMIEGRIEEGKFIAGTDNITIADCVLGAEIYKHIRNPDGKFHGYVKDFLKDYPKTSALADRYGEEWKTHLETREKHTM